MHIQEIKLSFPKGFYLIFLYMLTSIRGEKMAITYKLDTEMELIERHIKVLKAVIENQPVGIIKLSHMLNMPEHKIRYSLRLLEQEGIIEASPSGAKITIKAKEALEEIRKFVRDMEKRCEEISTIIDSINL